jgi:hypothetical protein
LGIILGATLGLMLGCTWVSKLPPSLIMATIVVSPSSKKAWYIGRWVIDAFMVNIPTNSEAKGLIPGWRVNQVAQAFC